MLWLAGVGVMSMAVWLVFVRSVRPLDLNVFLAAGRAVAHGHSPYPVLGSPHLWSGSAFVYPWVTAWIFAPAAAISSHAAALLMTVSSVAAIAAGVWSLAGFRLIPFACVLFSAPTIDGLQMRTLNALLFLGVCLAWRWRDRPAWAGLVIGLLVTLKLLCWPLAVWLLLTRRWRAATFAVGTGTILLGAGWVPLDRGSTNTYWANFSAHETIASFGLQGLLVRWSVPVGAAQLIGLGSAAVLIAIMRNRGDTMIYAAAVVGALLASPVVWYHYYRLAAAPLLLARNGSWWYLLIGWASVAARESYGLSWYPVSLLANVGLGIVGAIALVRLMGIPGGAFQSRRQRWLTVGISAVGATVLTAALIADARAPGGLDATVPVGASVTLLLIAAARPPGPPTVRGIGR
jgi:hypothetical protein